MMTNVSDARDELPCWNLADLYPAPDSIEIHADLETVTNDAEAFAERCRGRIAEMTEEAFAEAIVDYERLGAVMGRAMSYAFLWYSENVSDPERGRFLQRVQEQTAIVSGTLVFFPLEINSLEDAALEVKCGAAMQRYSPWLDTVRTFRAHQLSDEMERLQIDYQMVSGSAWVRLFEETMAALRFPVGEEMLTFTEAVDLLSDPDREVRRTAAKAIGQGLGDNTRLFVHIFNTLLKEHEIDDRWRQYPHPLASRNLGNQIEDAVVEALVSAVRDSYPRLSHRYYALKARWFGLDHLEYWDRNAPLPQNDPRRYGWPEARDIVLGACHAFSPEMAAIGQRFFDHSWIDAPPRPGKAGGAFAHPTVPAAHPYLLLNYMGKRQDVMTLAHELGHGIHQVLSAEQGTLLADPSPPLSETASLFGEMVTFRAMLAAESDLARRRFILAEKVENMLNATVRQIAFHTFESAVHTQRRQGELSVEEIGRLWMQVQDESLGPAVHFDEEYAIYWASITHFIEMPFYVYSYAFGECLVNTLYAVYQSGAVPDFQDRYIAMLRAGGTLQHKALLAPFGLDASDPAFWQRGLNVIAEMIDALEG